MFRVSGEDGSRLTPPPSGYAARRHGPAFVAALVLGATLWLLLTPAHSWGILQPAAAVQPNGKVLVTVVSGKEVKVARLRRNGKLDRRFGHRGFASTGLGKRALAIDMITGPSGEIDLAAEFKGLHVSDFAQAVIQLTRNGELDSSFGVDGVAQPFSGRGVIDIGGLARSADGHLLVAAQAGTPACSGVYDPEPCEYTQLVASLDANGQLDANFGDGGMATIPVRGQLVELAVAPNGGVVTGTTTAFGPSSVSRLRPDGALDATFGGGAGYVQTSVPVTGVAVSPGGQIYAGGAYVVRANDYSDAQVFGATALNADGSVHEGFATNGSFASSLGELTEGIGSLLREPDGGLVLAGPVASHCKPPHPTATNVSPCRLSAGVVRLDASGNPVAGFGDDGIVTLPIARPRTFFAGTYGVQALDSRDGLRVATPLFYGPERAELRGIAVAALRDDGSLDRRYGKDGLSVVRVE